MTYKDVVKQLAKDLGMSRKDVEKVYKEFYWAINRLASNLPLKQDLTEEEFNNLHCNFWFPYIGTIYITKQRYFKLRNRYKDRYENKEGNTNSEQNSNNS